MTLLSSLYLAPIPYYAALFHADDALIEVHDNYQKQSYRNRCIIAGANGTLSLSIPIEKPAPGKYKMKDIRIADHGNWQHLHWNAIISAYNSTPFFQYFEEDFRPFYEKKVTFLHDFNEQLRQLVCRFLGIETAVSYTPEYTELHQTPPTELPTQNTGTRVPTVILPSTNTTQQVTLLPRHSTSTTKHHSSTPERIDLREAFHPKKPAGHEMCPYYQVFAEKTRIYPQRKHYRPPV